MNKAQQRFESGMKKILKVGPAELRKRIAASKQPLSAVGPTQNLDAQSLVQAFEARLEEAAQLATRLLEAGREVRRHRRTAHAQLPDHRPHGLEDNPSPHA